jgi:hypothetical protein
LWVARRAMEGEGVVLTPTQGEEEVVLLVLLL